MQETRQIVEVQTLEFGSPGTGGGAGGPGGAPKRPSPGRVALRLLVIAIAVAIAIPALALGLGCLVAAVAFGLAVWVVRAVYRAFGGGRRAAPANAPEPPVADEALRENVRVKRPAE